MEQTLDEIGQLEKDINGSYLLSNKTREINDAIFLLESNTRSYLLGTSGLVDTMLRDNMAEIRGMVLEFSQLAQSYDVKGQLTQLNQLLEEKLQLIQKILPKKEQKDNLIALSILDLEGATIRNKILKITEDLKIKISHYNTQKLKENQIKNAGIRQNSRYASILNYLVLLLIIFVNIYAVRQHRNLESKLKTAKDIAERASTVKENFMANMSHEIRTPLNAIIGFTHFLKKESLSKKGKSLVDGIENGGEKLLGIVNDILDFSRIEAGMLRLEKIPFSISGLVHSVEQMFRYRTDEKGLDLQIILEQPMPDLLIGDPIRLTQILINLLNNAVKFTEKGAVHLQIIALSEAHNQVELEFIISDTGEGIPADRLPYIFDRFTQAGEDTTRRHGGSGLGLSIVKQLVELQHGTIEAVSEQNKGSTFRFVLSYGVDTTQEHLKKPAQKTMADSKSLFSGWRVLLVEDNPMNTEVAGMMLESWGMDFDHAQNGKVALKNLQAGMHYDLILMDIQMPVLDGYQTSKAIRNDLKLDIPIIAMTAHAFAGEREKCLGYGMNDYLSKPIRESAFLNILRRFTWNKNPGNSLEEPVDPPERKQNDSLINESYLQEISRGKPENIDKMLALFLRQFPEELAQLNLAVQEKQFKEIGRLAHTMRTTLGYMGFSNGILNHLQTMEGLANAENAEVEQIEMLHQRITQLSENALLAVIQFAKKKL
ncbi:MAG: hypothetical protein DHS20C18_42960 [Saprospiraceae bacterium]|nr:MAG: hypothetical protein DHS20C18_42960 [Saprospiraceae bacterium]